MAESILAYISKYKICTGIQEYTKFLFKFKKPYFWPIFCPFSLFFGAKNVFPKKSGMQNFIRFSRTRET